jgi:hypothetical protein
MVITGDFYGIIYVYIISCHIRGCESNQGSAALLSLASKAPDRTVRDPGSRLPHWFAGNISQVRRDPTRLQVDYIIIIIIIINIIIKKIYTYIIISHHISSYLIIVCNRSCWFQLCCRLKDSAQGSLNLITGFLPQFCEIEAVGIGGSWWF